MSNESKRFDVMTLGERIRFIRKQRGISQETLASLVFTKKQTISLYEQDRLELKVSMLKRVAVALEVPTSIFIDEEECGCIKDVFEEKEMMNTFKNLGPELKRVALEQLRALGTLKSQFCVDAES